MRSKPAARSVRIGIKRLPGSEGLELPGYETEGSAGMDLRAAVEEEVLLRPGEIRLIPTGLAVSIPPGYEAQLRPRSGLALRHGIGMVNAPGTIDSDYRGEIGLVLINWGSEPYSIRRGERIGQMVINRVFKAEFEELLELDDTGRGEGGFGHSGIN